MQNKTPSQVAVHKRALAVYCEVLGRKLGKLGEPDAYKWLEQGKALRAQLKPREVML